MIESTEGGLKNDQEKTRLELLSSTWLMGVGAVLTFGAKKYAAHNWRKGITLSRLLGACLRHVIAFLGGEDLDPETGLSHLYHASCCLMFASELYETNPQEVDDRYRSQKLRVTEGAEQCGSLAELHENAARSHSDRYCSHGYVRSTCNICS